MRVTITLMLSNLPKIIIDELAKNRGLSFELDFPVFSFVFFPLHFSPTTSRM